MTTKLLTRVIPLVILLCAASGCANFQLSARPSKATYGQGEQVEIEVVLTNTGLLPGRVAEWAEPTLTVVKVARDGSVVSPKRTGLIFDEDFATQLALALRRVWPGGSTTFSWKGESGSTGLQSLRALKFGPEPTYGADDFPVAAPGKYKITLLYQFPRDAAVRAHKRPTAPVDVEFTVNP